MFFVIYTGMDKRKSIAIDMDGVIADVEAQAIIWYERKFGEKILRESFVGRAEADLFPEKGLIREFVFTEGFFLTLPVMPGAIEAVKKLQDNFEVYIVSAAMEFPLSLTEKLAWLNKHFPFITWQNIIFCGDKSIINTDCMIDDHIKNLDYFKGKTLMFNAFHNTLHNHHARYYNWEEILKFFKNED